jgi:hypothetical protein
MYNLNYAPTTLGVQSWREIISGGTRTEKKNVNTTVLEEGNLQLKYDEDSVVS